MTDTDEWVMIVWERLNKTGKWCSYSAEVSQLLEQSHRKHLSSACLGDADSKLQKYTVNLTDMVQVSDSTGTKCVIRRRVCDDLTVLSQGFVWQWHGDDEWNTYDIDVNNFIETSFIKGEKSVKLGKKFPGYHYEIDFARMLQINKHTKRKRTIRRERNANPYPVEKKTTSKVAKVSSDDSGSSSVSKLHPNLNEEVLGAAALEQQVNQYIRNVQNPVDCSADQECPPIVSNGKANHSNSNDSVSNGTIFKEKIKTSTPDKENNTAALVDGKPWMNSWPPDTPDHLLKPVPGIDPLPEFKKAKGWKKKLVQFEGAFNKSKDHVLDKYTEIVKDCSSFGDENCIICCELLSHGSSYNNDSTVLRLTLCNHAFHKACLAAMQKAKPKDMFIQCPTCKKIHGEKCGIQPPGNMYYHILPYSLPGYRDYETIRIIYDIRPGTQGLEHPNPGKKYTTRGFPRHCYLPDNEMGRKILRLLVKAWNRRLIFTIGRSSTTGEENTVTWNEIHHKTEFGFNRRGHGYPDPNYFENIMAELAAHGVVDDEVYEWYPA